MTITIAPHEPLRLPGVQAAAIASIGAGLIHAGAIGMNADHVGLARLFVAAAAIQLAFGVAALVRPRRLVATIGAAGNLAVVGAWLFTRLKPVSFIGGLEARQTAHFTDSASALLGLVAAGLALAAVLIGWRREPAQRMLLPCVAVAILAVPALVAGAHVTAKPTLISQASASSAPAATGPTTTPAGVGSAAAPTSTTLDESTPHIHNADGTVTVIGAGTGAGAGAGAADTSTTFDESTPHVHPAAVVAPVPYDPTLPIDLSGVPGVTPQEQARAENLVAVTIVRLPQWDDPATAVAAGFESIGDGATGFEHYINWKWIDDNDTLDPDHPESLVYQPQPDGTKKLLSAMFMLPDTVKLTDVPDIGGALTQWHIHDNLCFTKDPVAPKVAGLTDGNGNCPASLQKFQPAPMIHVWIVPTACGPFSALEGVGAGQVADGQTRNCDHVHGSSTGLLG